MTHDQSEAMVLGDRICVIYGGVIQQVAKPMKVYKQPNFVMHDIEIVLPTKIRDSLSSYKGKEISLEIRPDHLSMRLIEGQDRSKITATVDIVEPFVLVKRKWDHC